jgi:uncharacterized metal-binding protein
MRQFDPYQRNASTTNAADVRKYLESRNYSVYSWLSHSELRDLRELREGRLLGLVYRVAQRDRVFSAAVLLGGVALGLASLQILLVILACLVVALVCLVSLAASQATSVPEPVKESVPAHLVPSSMRMPRAPMAHWVSLGSGAKAMHKARRAVPARQPVSR